MGKLSEIYTNKFYTLESTIDNTSTEKQHLILNTVLSAVLLRHHGERDREGRAEGVPRLRPRRHVALALGHGFMDGLVSIAAVDPFVVRDVGISIAALLLMPISLFILRESYWNIKWFVVVACATSALTYYQLGYLLSAAPATTPHGIYIEQLLCALLFGACAAPACVLWWRRCTSSRDGGGNGGGDGDGSGGGGGPNGFTVRRFRPTPATEPGPEPEPDDISLAQSQQPAAGGAGPSAELRRMNGVSSSRRP